MENPPVLTENKPKPTKTKLKITPKQERFAREYVIDHNATRSAIAAGYSPRSAQTISSKILSKDIVQSFIGELDSSAAADLGITHRLILENVKGIAMEQKNKNPSASLKAFELLGKNIGTFEGDQLKTKDIPQWTGVEIDFGDGKLKVVTGTGALDTKD